ncbi:MAG: hypothetical protein ACLUFH_00345 [Monoglobales bacterium]
MEKRSCKNCSNLDVDKKETMDGRLIGRYRYGCSGRKSGYICGFLSDDSNLEVLLCEKWENIRRQRTEQERISSDYDEKLQNMFDRWSNWKSNGCPEAEVADGVYLNRIRSGIQFVMQQIEDSLDEAIYPECYYAPIPPIMEEDYMANCGHIEHLAEEALRRYQMNGDCQWLLEHSGTLRNSDKEKSEAYRLLCHVDNLENALHSKDYLTMKRESQQVKILSDMAACRQRIQKKKLKGIERRKQKSQELIGQMDIFEAKAS